MSESAKTGTGTLEFFREVTKYFMDFLETDFHKQRLPKRTIKSRNAGNLLVGFNLKKYESFQQVIEKYIATAPALSVLVAIKLLHQRPSLVNWAGIAATTGALALITVG